MTDAALAPRDFTVSAEESGQRLDRFLDGRCPDFSRSQIQHALADGRVSVDGRQRPKSFKLEAGAQVRFAPPPPPRTQAAAEDLPLRIVHEDVELIVVDKPAGMVVHPAPGHPGGTLVNALLHHCPRLADGAEHLRPGIVHRLDRDTSGLLVVALTGAAHRDLAGQLRRRELGRGYLALSWGRWAEPAGSLQGAIGRHPRQRQRMAVLASGGRPAVTHYEVSEDFDFVQLCRVKLQTGRTHQIRVHFADAGHPLVGDPVYGDDRRARNVRPVERGLAARLVKLAERQLLHAAELSLRHPRDGRALTFTAPPPADLAAALALLRPSAEEKNG